MFYRVICFIDYNKKWVQFINNPVKFSFLYFILLICINSLIEMLLISLCLFDLFHIMYHVDCEICWINNK